MAERAPTETASLRSDSASPKRWPVSLLGCLGYHDGGDGQAGWPWLLAKAALCPAALLGANETLFQEEELADVGCLQPHSCCGPTCRELNALHCGLGNEGLKLAANMCLLQALCSCACLGLPFVAWWTALQRQRVAAKHSVDDSREPGWLSTALFPCSLLQMHALLQQAAALHQQQQAAAPPPHKAPKMQAMTAASDCHVAIIQAPAASAPGPLTSGLSSSKVLRAVRTHAARGGDAGSLRGGGSRLCDSPGCSSDTSDGVDSPYSARHTGTSMLSPGTPDPLLPEEVQACASSNAATAPGSPAGTPRCQQQRRQAGLTEQHSSRLGQQLAVGAEAGGGGTPRHLSSAGAADSPRMGRPQPQLPPKHRSSMSRHARTSSLGGDGAAAAGLRASAAGAVAAAAAAVPRPASSPEPSSRHDSSAGGGGSRPSGLRSSCAPSSSVAAAAAPGGGSLSCSRSLAGSANKLLLSHDDVPLCALKPSPGRLPRGMSGGLSSSTSRGGLGASWARAQSSVDAHPAAAGALEQQQRASNAAPARPSTAGAQPSQQQYGTCQSDVCNYASWLAGAGTGASVVAQPPPQQQVSREASASSQGSAAASDGRQGKHARDRASTGVPPPAQQQQQQQSQPSALSAAGRRRLADWAYMSDVCNLGGSFDMGRSSASGGSCSNRLAAERSSGGCSAATPPGAEGSQQLAPDSSSEDVQSADRAAAAAGGGGSVSSSQQCQQQQQQQARPTPRGDSWPIAGPSPQSTLNDTAAAAQDSSSSVGAAAAAGAAGPRSLAPPPPSGSAAQRASSSRPASVGGPGQPSSAAAAEAGGASRPGSSSSAQQRGAAAQLDSAVLQAVTGSSTAEALTASQQELAAKLARLAFSSPAAARQLAGHVASAAQQQQAPLAAGQAAGEPFYPTMMTDICNLGDPDGDAGDDVGCASGDGDACASSGGGARRSGAATAGLLGSAAAAPLSGRLQRSARVSTGRQQQLLQAQQARGSLSTGGGAAGAAGRLSHASRPAGCSSLGGGGRPPMSAAAAAGAGPLKAAMMVRGQPPRPGGARPAPASSSRTAACSARSSAAGGLGGVPSHAMINSLDSVLSYYPPPQEDTRSSSDLGGGCGAAAAGKTYTVTPCGNIVETPGVSGFGSGIAAAAAAAATAAGKVQRGKLPSGALAVEHGGGGAAVVYVDAAEVVAAASSSSGGGGGAGGAAGSVNSSSSLWPPPGGAVVAAVPPPAAAV